MAQVSYREGTRMSDVDIEVNRWKRFGHDRLYVSAQGTKLGYWDNQTQTVHPEAPEYLEPLESALVAYRSDPAARVPGQRETSAETPVAPAVPVESSPTPTRQVERPWTDLALNRPGESVRHRAQAERQAAPVRTVVARMLKVHTPERAWRIGADGEAAVAARLSRLPDSWRVLHAVPIGSRGSDIDHVVIGPGGVYTVNAKHHPDANVWVGGDTVKVNGRNVPYVRNTQSEVKRAAEALSAAAGFPVFVTGLIAIVGAQKGLTVASQPRSGDVFVVGRKTIDDWLARRGPLFTSEQVDALFDVARKSTTWS